MAGAGFKYDEELFLEDIEKVFKANLNTVIANINDEKMNRSPGVNDKWELDTIPDEAWYLNHIPDIWSYPTFIVWGLANSQFSRPQNDGAILELTAFLEVAVQDAGDVPKEEFIYRLLRYSRSLREVAIKNFDSIRSYGKLRVDNLSPTIVNISDRSLRISGITITASIGLR